jgi:hypothetical protein
LATSRPESLAAHLDGPLCRSRANAQAPLAAGLVPVNTVPSFEKRPAFAFGVGQRPPSAQVVTSLADAVDALNVLGEPSQLRETLVGFGITQPLRSQVWTTPQGRGVITLAQPLAEFSGGHFTLATLAVHYKTRPGILVELEAARRLGATASDLAAMLTEEAKLWR